MIDTEKKTTRRRRAVLAGAAVLMAVFATAMIITPVTSALRTVDMVRLGGFVCLALVLAIRATTAFSLIDRNTVLDDELTRANRASAARVGFWAMFGAAIACFIAGFIEPVSAMQILPILIGAGAVAAALRFAVLEGRGGG